MDGEKDEGRGKEAEEGRKERERGGIFCTRSLAPSPHQTDPTDNDEHFSVATGHSHARRGGAGPTSADVAPSATLSCWLNSC